jgi:regulation of enolase protein 1 (concanavalin A-like superfamily)
MPRYVVIDPKKSDWSELDLLTNEEARDRLVAEIAALEVELADGGKVDSVRLSALRLRLRTLEESF